MSGTGNPLATLVAGNVPAATPAPMPPAAINQAFASRAMRGRTEEHMIRRRDAAGGELDILARIMNDPNPNPKEIHDYVSKLLRQEHISARQAGQLLASMPDDPSALRTWAQAVFTAVMHEGIHAHAAFPRELYPSPDKAQQSVNQEPADER